MQRYKNMHRNSGVVAFQLGHDYIDIEFRDGKRYRYTEAVPGQREVEAMKQLARSGQDLATFINQHVRDRFALRLR